MALFFWCINSFLLPNLGDATFTNFGERIPICLLDFCPKQSNMATVTSMTLNDLTQISWVKTVGSIVTFRVQCTATFQSGIKCKQVDSTRLLNQNFPNDVPELYIHIEEDTNGHEALQIDEEIEVNLGSNIYQAVNILVLVKEGGDVKRETVYKENPATLERPWQEDKA